MIKIFSIKSTLFEWILKNIERIVIFIIFIIMIIYVMLKFQQIIDSQKSVITELERQSDLHEIEFNRITNAYDTERMALEENIKKYEKRIEELQKKYEEETKKHEESKKVIVTSIMNDANGDPSVIANVVSDATGFLRE